MSQPRLVSTQRQAMTPNSQSDDQEGKTILSFECIGQSGIHSSSRPKDGLIPTEEEKIIDKDSFFNRQTYFGSRRVVNTQNELEGRTIISASSSTTLSSSVQPPRKQRP